MLKQFNYSIRFLCCFLDSTRLRVKGLYKVKPRRLCRVIHCVIGKSMDNGNPVKNQNAGETFYSTFAAWANMKYEIKTLILNIHLWVFNLCVSWNWISHLYCKCCIWATKMHWLHIYWWKTCTIILTLYNILALPTFLTLHELYVYSSVTSREEM